MKKRKIDIISLLVMSALLVVSYFSFLSDDISLYRSSRQKRSSIYEAIKRDASTVEREKKKMLDVLNLEKEIEGHRLFLPKEDSVPYFLDYFSSLARRYKVEILSIRPEGTVDGELFSRTTFTTELSGGFPNIYNFLYHLEEDWRGVKMETLSLTRDTEERSIKVKLTVAVLSIEGLKGRA